MLWSRRRWRMCPHTWRAFLATFALLYTGCVVWWIRTENERQVKIDDELCYHPPHTMGLKGMAFSRASQNILEKFSIPESSYVELSDTNVRDFVFLSAADNDVYLGLIDAVYTIQEYVPGIPIYVYDLGLTESQVEVVQKWCDVVYRKFNFTGLPLHIQNFRTFAWKPLIIMEVLKETPGVFWVDSSVRLQTYDLIPLLDKTLQTHGGVLLSSTGHSTFAATHPNMYQFLVPSNNSALKVQEQRSFSAALLFRTPTIIEQVLHWLALCALEESCIAPTLIRNCAFGNDSFGTYANCHRFGQSAINILMLNLYNVTSNAFYYNEPIIKIEHTGWGMHRPCTLQTENMQPDNVGNHFDTDTSQWNTAGSHQDTGAAQFDLYRDTDASQTDTDVSQTDTDISQTDTDASQTDTDASQTDTDISQTDTDVSQTDTDVRQTDTYASQTDKGAHWTDTDGQLDPNVGQFDTDASQSEMKDKLFDLYGMEY